jgi:microcystin-dependent protein
MSDQFLGEIRIFPFDFAPIQWAMCNGQLMAITQNAALFSILGTTYGGNGTSTFGLPNLQGRVPVCAGQGRGLSLYDLGQFGGAQSHTLNNTEIPSHNHNINADADPGTSTSPAGAIYRRGQIPGGSNPTAVAAYSTQAPDVIMDPNTLGITGGNQAHNNMMPYLTLNFCIALNGVFPPRG